MPSLGELLSSVSPACRQRNAGLLSVPAGGQGPGPVVEHRHADEPVAAAPAQKEDSGKYLVRVTSYRRRLLDEDNLAEKFHVDACRYIGLLPSDAPAKCHIITTQEKVRTKQDERTELLIERLP